MKKGFTLSEVLITLGIIGVISALTLPNLVGNYRSKILMTQLQNTINLVQSAVVKSMEDNAVENFGNVVSTESARENFMKTYFDPVATCVQSEDEGSGYANCLAKTYTSFDKTASATGESIVTNRASKAVCGTLTSGATVCVYGPYTDTSAKAVFWIDTNGMEEPNMNGKDLFWFWVRDNGKLAYSFSEINNELNNEEYDANDPEKVAEHNKKVREAAQAESDGASCKTGSINPEDVCLPYIISHGYKFKF